MSNINPLNNRKTTILKRKLDKDFLLAFLFLIPYFFLRVAYGSDNAHIDLSLGWIQILVGFYIFSRVWKKSESQGPLLVHLIIFAFVFIHLIFIVLFKGTGGVTGEALLFAFLPVYIYLFISLLTALNYINVSPLVVEKAFLKLSLFSILVAILTYLLSMFAGISVLLNFYGGSTWMRAHAFMTEPSGMSAPIAYVIAFGIINRKNKELFIGIIGLLVTQTTVAIIISILVALSALYIKTKYKSYYLTFIILISASMSGLFFSFDCMSSNENASIIINKSICGIRGLWELDNQVLINANPRLATSLMAFDMLSEHDGWITGFGLNSSAVLMRMHYGDLENSLFISLILFFGISGGMFYIIIAYWAYRNSRRFGSTFVLFYISLFLSVTLNSAGGFYGYMLYFFVVYILIVHKDSKAVKFPYNADSVIMPVMNRRGVIFV